MIDILGLRTVPDLTTVVSQIVAYRKRYKISQSSMAALVGISQSYLSKIENGISKDVPYDLVVKMLETLDVELMVGKIQIKQE